MEQHKQLILFQRVPAAITLMFWSGTAPPEIFALRYVPHDVPVHIHSMVVPHHAQ